MLLLAAYASLGGQTKEVKEGLKNEIKELKEEVKKEIKALADKVDALADKVDVVTVRPSLTASAVYRLTYCLFVRQEILTGVPPVLRNLAEAVKEVSVGEEPTGLVTASPAEVAQFLEEVGMGQYAPRLAPLGGVMLLMQTDKSLAAMHVLPEHRPVLLEHLRKFVRTTSRRKQLPSGGPAG
jgi:hypothetical protein